MNRFPQSRAGFTLVELLIGSTLAALIMAAVLSSYTYLGRSLARLSSYQALENESRKALNTLTRDFSFAQGVKTGTSPTATAVTLIFSSGEVSYTYDNTARTLRRQATFGVSPDLTFFHNDSCQSTAFAFRYFTTGNSAPTDQLTPTAHVPYSIKQIQVTYTLESPSGWSELTRTRYETASARFLFRNRGAPDGT